MARVWTFAELRKGGPYIGPRGGKWADPQHKIPWREETPKKWVIKDSVRGARGGQVNATLTAHGPDGKIAGKLDYSVYQGTPHIDMVEASVKRQGVGRALVRKLASQHGGYENVEWGMMTESGNALRAAMDKEFGVKREAKKPISASSLTKKHGGKVVSVEGGSTRDLQSVYAEFDSPSKARSFAKEANTLHPQEFDFQEHGGTTWIEVQLPLVKSFYILHPTLSKARKLHGRRKFAGMDISIENRKGSTRHWYDPHGKESGSTKMYFDYGYIRRTKGTDGDHIDVYLGPDKNSQMVYIVDQGKKDNWKEFDEQKVMLGFPSAKAARAAYLRQYDDTRFFLRMHEMPLDEFKESALASKDHGRALKPDTRMVIRR